MLLLYIAYLFSLTVPCSFLHEWTWLCGHVWVPVHLKPVILTPVGRMSTWGEFDLSEMSPGCFLGPFCTSKQGVAGSWLGVARKCLRLASQAARKRQNNGIWGHFSIFSPFLGHFSRISGRGPFSIFLPIFSHVWISAHFPFYTRRPDSQPQTEKWPKTGRSDDWVYCDWA